MESVRPSKGASSPDRQALDDVSMHLEQVKMRAHAGSHSAPESVLRAIYEASIGNLPRAIREMNFVHLTITVRN